MSGAGEAAGRKPKADPEAIELVSFEIQRERDGRRYPNQVKEYYALERGRLRYSAYFGGMPMEWNHMDGLDWAAGEASAALLAAIGAALRDPALRPDFRRRKDDEASPWPGTDGVYLIALHSGSTLVLADPKAKAWAAVARAFGELIARFEQATGRPLTPGQLPQR